MSDPNWDRFDAKEWAMGHDRLCTERWTTSNKQLGLIVNILRWMIGGFIGLMIVVTGYQYKQAQDLAQQLANNREQTADSLAQIPAKTARAIGVTPSPSN